MQKGGCLVSELGVGLYSSWRLAASRALQREGPRMRASSLRGIWLRLIGICMPAVQVKQWC